jgi:hypothetical protein
MSISKSSLVSYRLALDLAKSRYRLEDRVWLPGKTVLSNNACKPWSVGNKVKLRVRALLLPDLGIKLRELDL